MNIRIGFFLLGLVLFMFWEHSRPYLKKDKDWVRIGGNLGLGFFGSLIVAGLYPGGLYYMASYCLYKNVGVFHALHLPPIVSAVLTFFLLDLLIYTQHVISHRLPFLWKFHRIHHSDPFLDTSSALRFHPGEIVISFGIKAIVVALFGLHPLAVVTFEVVLNFSAMFNHSNFRLPSSIERNLRKLIVTPDFHRVHHSPKKPLTNSNYGFFLSIWDPIFGTLNKDHSNNSDFGLNTFKTKESQSIGHLLIAPFTSSKG